MGTHLRVDLHLRDITKHIFVKVYSIKYIYLSSLWLFVGKRQEKGCSFYDAGDPGQHSWCGQQWDREKLHGHTSKQLQSSHKAGCFSKGEKAGLSCSWIRSLTYGWMHSVAIFPITWDSCHQLQWGFPAGNAGLHDDSAVIVDVLLLNHNSFCAVIVWCIADFPLCYTCIFLWFASLCLFNIHIHMHTHIYLYICIHLIC